MSLQRQLLLSVVVQGAGAASLLLATLWLAVTLGPEQQGVFSRAKAEVEFVAAIALFGLPQALFYFCKAGALSRPVALRLALGSAVLSLPVAALCAVAWQRPLTLPEIAWLAVAVAACVAHGQLRALLLVREGTLWFNSLTAWPQVAVGVGLVFAVTAQAQAPWVWYVVFAVAFGTAALLAWLRLRSDADTSSAASAKAGVGWQGLARYGLAAWLHAVLATAAILLVQRWVEATEGAAALGQFTLAMTLVLVPLVPVSYAAPLLFRRWMEQPGARAARQWAAALCAALLLLAATVWALAGYWGDLGLGPSYDGVTYALAVLMAGAAAEAASKLLTVQAGARGVPWVAVRAEGLRWAVLVVAWWWLPAGLLFKCFAWAAAAWAAALVFVWYTRPAAVGGGGMA